MSCRVTGDHRRLGKTTGADLSHAHAKKRLDGSLLRFVVKHHAKQGHRFTYQSTCGRPLGS